MYYLPLFLAVHTLWKKARVTGICLAVPSANCMHRPASKSWVILASSAILYKMQ